VSCETATVPSGRASNLSPSGVVANATVSPAGAVAGAPGPDPASGLGVFAQQARFPCGRPRDAPCLTSPA
jgi:hypothetical protein